MGLVGPNNDGPGFPPPPFGLTCRVRGVTVGWGTLMISMISTAGGIGWEWEGEVLASAEQRPGTLGWTVQLRVQLDGYWYVRTTVVQTRVEARELCNEHVARYHGHRDAK